MKKVGRLTRLFLSLPSLLACCSISGAASLLALLRTCGALRLWRSLSAVEAGRRAAKPEDNKPAADSLSAQWWRQGNSSSAAAPVAAPSVGWARRPSAAPGDRLSVF